MIEGLKPYPEYKESGSCWLGAVPTSWQVHNLRTLTTRRNERNQPTLPLLSVAREKGVFVRSLTGEDENHNVIPEDLSSYKVARAGNLVINKMKAWQGSMGIAPCDGVVSPAYYVFEFRIANCSFGQALLRSKPYVAHFGQSSDGVRVGQWDLSIPGMRQIPVVVPPPEEQDAIVRFLDHANRRIERYIRAKKKLIALLNEQKQAIIHRAVTRGLDPNVRLKASGVEWLGDVPEYWEVMRFARVIADGPRNGISPPIDERGMIESFSISAVRDGKVEVRPGDRKYISGDKDALEQAYRLLRGDVLLVRGNGNIRLVGKAGVVEDDMPGRVYPDLLMRVRLTPRCLPQYLVALLNCPSGRDQIETAARTAVGTFKINNQQVRQLCLALPPIAEQQRVLGWLDAETGAITTVARQAGDEVSLLREYHTRLIADVVTGKVDVRPMAARLPEEPVDAAEPIEDSDSEDPSEFEDMASSGTIG